MYIPWECPQPVERNRVHLKRRSQRTLCVQCVQVHLAGNQISDNDFLCALHRCSIQTGRRGKIVVMIRCQIHPKSDHLFPIYNSKTFLTPFLYNLFSTYFFHFFHLFFFFCFFLLQLRFYQCVFDSLFDICKAKWNIVEKNIQCAYGM